MITVEDPADVAAFKDYVVPAAAPVATAPVVAAPSPTPVAIAAPPPPPPTPVAAAPVIAAAPAVPPPPPTPVVAASIPIVATSASNSFSTAIPGMTYMNTKKSPLTYALNMEQTKYIELYGTTGQSPIS
jgi:hypothetical protein